MHRHVPTVAAALVALTALAPVTSPSGADDPHVVTPGDLFVMEDGSGCAVGFLLDAYERTDDGLVEVADDYFVTAGHCFVDAGARSWSRGQGPGVSDGRQQYGEAVYARKDWQLGVDVALVRLTVDPSGYDPAVCFWGGPSSLAVDPAVEGETLRLTGAGSGPVLRAREVTATRDQSRWVEFLGPSINGDSGGPLLDADGAALGIVALGGVGFGPDVSTGSASHLPTMLTLLEEQVGLELEVMTAPLRDEPWPEGTLTEGCGAPVEVP